MGLLAAYPRTPLVLGYYASPPRELRYLRSHVGALHKRLLTYPLEIPLRVMEAVSLRRASELLILSEFTRELLAADHPNQAPRARLVPGLVNTDLFSPAEDRGAIRTRLGLRPDIPLLLSVRRLEPRMGLERLFHAVKLLRGSRDVDLVVAGAGRLDESLRRLVANLGLQSHVRFLGRVPDDALRDWYRAADLFVLPTVAYEGFGMVTAEALASGTPVVGTPVGATPELLAPLDRRLVAKSSDVDDIAAAVSGALGFAGPELRARCREYASANYSWDTAIQAWEDVLIDAAGRRAAPRNRDADKPRRRRRSRSQAVGTDA